MKTLIAILFISVFFCVWAFAGPPRAVRMTIFEQKDVPMYSAKAEQIRFEAMGCTYLLQTPTQQGVHFTCLNFIQGENK